MPDLLHGCWESELRLSHLLILQKLISKSVSLMLSSVPVLTPSPLQYNSNVFPLSKIPHFLKVASHRVETKLGAWGWHSLMVLSEWAWEGSVGFVKLCVSYNSYKPHSLYPKLGFICLSPFTQQVILKGTVQPHLITCVCDMHLLHSLIKSLSSFPAYIVSALWKQRSYHLSSWLPCLPQGPDISRSLSI